MYKTIDIADIIGTVVHEFESVSVFPMERIDCVFQKVSLADRFIRLEYSRSALLRVEDLADNDLLFDNDIITINHMEDVRNRFINSFYSLDYSTQLLLDNIVKEVFENE
jgi:hypothetical protein